MRSQATALNAAVFAWGRCRMSSGFPDGTSHTILFGEHYSVCNRSHFEVVLNQPNWPPFLRLATFADELLGDDHPVTSGNLPFSRSSRQGRTFQTSPKPAECDFRLAQTPHSSGMLVVFADGSGRTIEHRIAEPVYWALIIPTRGGIVSNW